MDFFIRYGTSWQTTTTVQRPTSRALRKGHAVRLSDLPGTPSLCGRRRLQGDVDERGHDFADLGFPARCAVCAGMMSTLAQPTH